MHAPKTIPSKARAATQGASQQARPFPAAAVRPFGDRARDAGPTAALAPRAGLDVPRDAGRPLGGADRAFFERGFGHDFSGVRIHDEPAAHARAASLDARAYTVGDHVVFGQGAYRPGTSDGQRLIAHELAHVVQQRGGAGGPGDARHETAADAAADAVTRGACGPVPTGPAAMRGIQRQPLPARQADSPGAGAGDAASAPAARLQQEANAELARLAPLVAAVAVDVPLHPADHALNDIRQLDAQLGADAAALDEFEAFAGDAAAGVRATKERSRALQQSLAPALAAAIAWHAAHPAGESLGMTNERVGTDLAGEALHEWDAGGVRNRVLGGLHMVGAAGVATLDAAEKVASMGFHDAATAVAQAYARGDISWNEGERILRSAAGRALAIAAVSAGVAGAAGRLAALRAEAAGLASTSLSYGAAVGAASGSVAAVAGLATQAAVTRLLGDWLASPAGKAIWHQGMPTGWDWAIAIPLGLVMGALGGMRGVEAANQRLVGTVVDTPSGPMRVDAVTRLGLNTGPGKGLFTPSGNMLLRPVNAPRIALPAVPASPGVLVFDPVSGSWTAVSETAPAGLARPAPSARALAPTTPSHAGPSGAAGALRGIRPPPLTGIAPRPALPAHADPSPSTLPAAAAQKTTGAIRVVTVSKADFDAALRMTFPGQFEDRIEGLLDDIGRQPGARVVANPSFVAAVQNRNWRLAGTLFHSEAAQVIRALPASALPAGWTLEAEVTIKPGLGGSRLDTFLRGPGDEQRVYDWKTTGRSALSTGSRKEMARHRAHLAANTQLAGTLSTQQSRSWVDYVRPLLPGVTWPR